MAVIVVLSAFVHFGSAQYWGNFKVNKEKQNSNYYTREKQQSGGYYSYNKPQYYSQDYYDYEDYYGKFKFSLFNKTHLVMLMAVFFICFEDSK